MPADNWIGKLLLERYRPVHVLAAGGQGVVYLARDEGAAGGHRPVVIKRILPTQRDDQQNARFFLREARLLAEMDHRNILDIVDLDEEDGDYVMVLEYVRGYHLGRWQRLHRTLHDEFPWEFAAHAVALIADALAHVHEKVDEQGQPLGIVHRDVTPANILIDVEGAVKLADFGIARTVGDHTEQVDGEEIVRGNFAYIAPEVFVGEPVGAPADIYSLGMVLHRLVSGVRVQVGDTLEDTMQKALYEVPPRLDELRDDVPPELADLVARAVEKEPDSRFSSASEFARRLRELLHPEVPRLFAEAAKSDFERSDAAKILKTNSLSALDRRWRDFDPSKMKSRKEESGRNLEWWLVALIAALVVVGGIIAYALGGGDAEDDAQDTAAAPSASSGSNPPKSRQRRRASDSCRCLPTPPR